MNDSFEMRLMHRHILKNKYINKQIMHTHWDVNNLILHNITKTSSSVHIHSYKI